QAYAVLDADGWEAPAGQPFVQDEKLYYAHGDESASLNWRPATDGSEAANFGSVVGHTTMDGESADIRDDGGTLTVVGPVHDGRMLTLSPSSNVDVDALRALATHVHRQ